MAAPAAPRRGQREGPGERLVEFAVVGGMASLAIAFALPLLAVGAPVWLALHALRRRSWRVLAPALAVCLLPLPAALLWGYATRGALPGDAVAGYVNVQLDAAEAVARSWPVTEWAPLLTAYGQTVWPYAVAGGAAMGATFHALHSLRGGAFSRETQRNESLRVGDAGVMAEAPEEAVDWTLPEVLGRGVVALLSAPPGLGKGWWTWGWLRAMQDGADFFGLRVRRPYSRPNALARRLGAKARPLRVLWLAEEGASFARTAKRFGIAPGLVRVLQRQDVAATAWPEIVALVRREAWRRGCAYVVVDTVRAWCPQAEQTNELAAAVFNLARRELAAPGLGVLFAHHDRKGGGEYGEGVAGPNNLVGSTDVLIELKRVKGDPSARRMLVSRRFGEKDLVARLEGHRYVIDGVTDSEETEAEATAPSAPPVAAHLVATLDALRAEKAWLEPEAVMVATGGASTTVTRRLAALRDLGLVEHRGAGVKGSPLEWRAIDETPPPLPPTSDPAYVRYLGSKAWADKRAEVLARASGQCEDCGAGVPEGETEVHHLTYERIGRELPEDLVALCPGCHRRAHASR